jgi:hypothetical protein
MRLLERRRDTADADAIRKALVRGRAPAVILRERVRAAPAALAVGFLLDLAIGAGIVAAVVMTAPHERVAVFLAILGAMALPLSMDGGPATKTLSMLGRREPSEEEVRSRTNILRGVLADEEITKKESAS